MTGFGIVESFGSISFPLCLLRILAATVSLVQPRISSVDAVWSSYSTSHKYDSGVDGFYVYCSLCTGSFQLLEIGFSCYVQTRVSLF